MAARPSPKPEPCFADAPLVAQDVARGVTRLFFNRDMYALCEVPLPNGRRADMMAIDSSGLITIVEIKVSRADLMGDCKWLDYLGYCDRFYWAVPNLRSGAVRRARIPAPALRPDRRRPLRCGGYPRSAVAQACARPPEGGDPALRPAGGAAAGGGS